MRNSQAVIPAVLVTCLALSVSAEWREVDYRDFHAVFSRIEQMQGARYTRATATFSVTEDAGVTLPELRLVIAAPGGDIEVPVDADGATRFPISERLYEQNPPVRVNAAAGTLQANLRLTVEAPPRTRFPFQLVLDMDAEYRALVAKQGMLARLMMPDAEGLLIQFGPGPRATARVGGASGKTFHADEKGSLTIPLERRWRKPGVEVELSRAPTTLRLLLR